MLVLSRKPGQKILIGNDITLEVVELRGNQVRFGIVAPREMPVDREEVRKAVDRDGQRRDDRRPGGGKPGNQPKKAA